MDDSEVGLAEAPIVNPAFRWSFSQWESYNECPFRWKCQSVLKLPRSPAGPAAARGLEMHDRAENYIKGERDHLDPEPSLRFGDRPPALIHPRYIPILDEFRHHPNGARHTELKIAFDEDWHLVPKNDPKASCIMVFDAVRSGGAWSGLGKGEHDGQVWVGEWKSGKFKATHADQRKMYAMGALKYFYADKVTATTFYLEDTHPPQALTAEARHFVVLTDMWSHRRDLMRRDQICAPRPGMYCRWCDYSASKGGPCKF